MNSFKYFKDVLYPMFMKKGRIRKKYRKYKKYFRDLGFSLGNTPDVYITVHYKQFGKYDYPKIRKRTIYKQHLKELKNSK